MAVAACFAGSVHALPVAPTVASGSAAFSQAGGTLTVTNTPNAIINWQGFSIGQGEATRFIQQSAASAVLNRVTGGDPSSILGQLQSNGRVFLINPNGITFGASAQIDVAGLVASSLHLSDADFINGRFKFFGSDSAGKVVNHAQIQTPEGGRVWLIAPRVENSGLITTPGGEIILAAGKSIEITDPRNSSVRVQIDAPADEALNIGQLISKSGTVGMYGRVVRSSGQINANAAVVENGRVVFRRNSSLSPDAAHTAGTVELKASETLSLEGAATISADGPVAGKVVLKANAEMTLAADTQISANGVDGGRIDLGAGAGTLLAGGLVEARGEDGPGGLVMLTGHRVGLLQRSKTDVSGVAGGGTVLVGGDFQGKNPDVQNAKAVFVAPEATIKADALYTGDGGKVIVWADETTRYYGSISATGGAVAGDGGFVEVSGKKYLEFKGGVDVGSVNGAGGTLLLDPTNITLTTSDTNTAGFTPPADITEAFADDDAMNSSFNVGAGGSFSGVAGGGNIVLQATNDITVSNAFNVATATGAANVGLTLTANNSININAAITVTGSGALSISADADGIGGGDLAINAGGTISAQAGGVTLRGANITSVATGTISANGAANANAGNLDIRATSGNVSLQGNVSAIGGTASAGNPGRSGGAITIEGAGISLGTATVTANGSNGSGASQTGGAGGSIALTSTNGISGSGAMAASGGNSGTGNAIGGSAGSIAITNNTSGNVTTGALTASTGNAAGTGAGGTTSTTSINVTNSASGGSVTVGAVTTTGGTKGNGGNVVLSSQGALTATTITTSGGTALTGNAGRNAGTITIDAGGAISTGAITANGSNGVGANQAGGNGAAVQVTSTGGNLSVTSVSTIGGNAVATAAGGNAGTITLDAGGTTPTVTVTGNLTATGGTGSGAAGGDGKKIWVKDDLILAANAVLSSVGGTGSTAGAGGDIVLAGGISSSVAARTLSLTAGTGDVTVSGAMGAAGGVAALSTLTITGNDISVGSIGASGIAGVTGATALTASTAGADAGEIIFTGSNYNANAQTYVATVGNTLQVTSGAATTFASSADAIRFGNAADANGGTLQLGNGSDLTVSTANGTIDAYGGVRGHSAEAVTLNAGTSTISVGAIGNADEVGAVSLTASTTTLRGNIRTAEAAGNNVTVTGALTLTGNTSIDANRSTNKGDITITGTTTATGLNVGLLGKAISTGAITTTGGANQAGGTVTITASSTVSAGAITTSGGTASAGNPGRNAGNLTINAGDAVTAGAINALGSNGNGATQAGGAGGTVSIASTGGAVSVNVIATTGGNGGTGAANGGNAGAITLDAGGAAPTITLAGNLTATGGNRSGAGTAGAGAQIWLKDDVLLNAATVTVDARGGSAGVGAGGAIRFDGAIDSTGGARALVLNTSAATQLNGAVGAGSALLSLSTDTGGTTQIGGSSVNTNGAAGQSWGDSLSLTANSSLNAVGGTVAFASTVAAAGFDLAIAGTEISIAANVTGTGALTLKPSDTLTSMTIASGADTGAAILDLTTTELAFIQSGFSSVTYGRNDSASSTTVSVNSTQLRAATSILTGGGTISGAGNITGDVAGRGLTVSAGSGGIVNLSGTLGTAGTRLGAVSISAGGASTLGAINANGRVLLTAGGNLTLNGIVSTTDTGSDAIVASAGANFVNNAGASALATGIGGRWLVYTNDPNAASFGGLASGNLALWNKTYTGNPPSGIALTGNRYLFNQAPNLTVTSTTNATKTYGDDITASLASQYTITGANTGTFGGAVVADSSVALGSLVSGAPALSSTGSAGTGSVAGSPHTVSITQGTLSGTTGYGFSFVSAGTITVNPASLTVAADNITKIYGDADPALTFVATGLKNGESQSSVISGSQVRVSGEGVAGGPYAISQGSLTSNSNYRIAGYTGANLTINKAALSVTAVDDSRKVADPNPEFSATYSGFKFGESSAVLGGNLQFSTPAVYASGYGNYPITPSGLASDNYTISYFSGNLRIDSANLTGVTTTVNLPELQRGGLPPLQMNWIPSSVRISQSSSITSNRIVIVSAAGINSLPATAAGGDEEDGAGGEAGTGAGSTGRSGLGDKSLRCAGGTPMDAFSCLGGG